MKNVVVVFKSKYGSTKAYAMHIAQALKCDCIDMSQSAVDVSTYDIVIYGGGLYAGGINGFSQLKKQAEKLREKQLYIFTCGIANPQISENYDKIVQDVEKQIGDVLTIQKLFMFRGALDYRNMSFKHRMMMKMMVSMLKKKPEHERGPEGNDIIASYGGQVSYVDVSQSNELIQLIEIKRKE